MEKIHSMSKGRFVLLVASLVLLVVMGYLFYTMYSTITSRDGNLASLNTQIDELNDKNKDLGSKNTNLKGAVEALQNQLKHSSEVNSSDNQQPERPSVVKPVAKMEVIEVRDQPGTDYSVPGYVPYPDVRVVHLTITNLTDTPQEYHWFQFEATLNDGQMVKGLTYGPIEGKNWVNSKLAPKGSQKIELLFKRSQDLTLLSWSPELSPKPIVATLPAPIALP